MPNRGHERIQARPEILVPAWPRYLAVVQLVVVYSFTGLQKVGEGWGHAGGYSALFYTLQRPNWQRFDMAWLAHVYPLTQVATFATVYWEMSAPLLLLFYYYRYTPERGGRLRGFCLRHDARLWFLGFGVMLHLGIAATMEVGVFSYITLAFYFCCLHPDEWIALGRRLWRRLPAPIRRRTGAPGKAGRFRDRWLSPKMRDPRPTRTAAGERSDRTLCPDAGGRRFPE